MTFMATYSYRSSLKRRMWSVRFSIRSMHVCMPPLRANVMDLPMEMRISPGVDTDR